MPAPSSYTGEDSAEISCHGNPLLVERLLQACMEAGARMATPGEFTKRALLNGRLDLTSAEAVLQTIDARSASGLEIAMRGMDGSLQKWASGMSANLLEVAADMEARLDFPQEGTTPPDDMDLIDRLVELGRETLSLARTFKVGRILVEGARVALVGPVNAGKSSLYNALLGKPRALVSEFPGTTRDVLESSVTLDGVQVTLLDTAGDRASPGPIERAGLELRDEMLKGTDLLLVVLPAHLPRLEESRIVLERTDRFKRLLVANHWDRVGAVDIICGQPAIRTCALSGYGLDELKKQMKRSLCDEIPESSGLMIASQRQRDLLLRTAHAVNAAVEALEGEAGLAAASLEVTEALEGLDQMSGRNVREEVLNNLFSRFCVGK